MKEYCILTLFKSGASSQDFIIAESPAAAIAIAALLSVQNPCTNSPVKSVEIQG